MISYKILTILNVIIILSYCSVNNDLTEKQKIFYKKCVASLIKVGFKYDSGFVNFCYSMQFTFQDFRNEKTQGMYLEDYVKNIIITEKNEDEQMTDKEFQDIEDLVNRYNSETFQYFSRKINEIKNPKDFCTGIYSEVKSSNYFTRLKAKLNIKICTGEILKKYDKKNEFRNVVITYETVINLKQKLSDNKIDELIESWPKGERQYFKYHIKMINDHDTKESKFSIRTWCNDYIKKKNKEIESPEDINLTDEVNKTIETDPIQGNIRARFTIESIENK